MLMKIIVYDHRIAEIELDGFILNKPSRLRQLKADIAGWFGIKPEHVEIK